MQSRRPVVIALALVLSASCRPSLSQSADAGPLALTHVTVIDGTGAAPRPDMTVLIENGRIVRVQPTSSPLPARAREMNLAGRFLIPGLIDAHVHLGTQPRPPGVMGRILRAGFLGGVTSVRDMGGPFELVESFAKLGRQDSVPIPRVVYSAIVAGPGMWLEGERARFFAGSGVPGQTPTVRRLVDSADAIAAVASARPPAPRESRSTTLSRRTSCASWRSRPGARDSGCGVTSTWIRRRHPT